ncbi:MAG: TRAP transporter substrate-binding protein DctP [Spirochaetia bacterium]
MRSGSASAVALVAAVVASLISVAQVFSPPPVVAGGRSEELPETTLRLGYGGPADAGRNPAHSFAEELQREVDERSGGRMSVLLFPDNQLGTPRELLDGGASLTIAPATVIEELVPELRAAAIPFLFPDREAARRFYRESEFFARVESVMEEAAGARILEVVEVPGAVGFSNAVRPLRSPADFSGLSFATGRGRYGTVVRAFGAEVVGGNGGSGGSGGDGMGDAAGMVATAPELLAAGMHTRFTYRSEVGLAFPVQYLLAGRAALESLSADDRRIIVAAATAAAARHGDRTDARAATVRTALETAGVQFFIPGPMEREELRRIAQPAYIDELERSISLEWITLALDGAAETEQTAESDQ